MNKINGHGINMGNVPTLSDGTERIHVINRKDYQEDLITNIDYVMHFIKQELRVRYEMTGRPQREEIYEIPMDAIREAVVNAVSHRDYFQYGAHTTVEVSMVK